MKYFWTTVIFASFVNMPLNGFSKEAPVQTLNQEPLQALSWEKQNESNVNGKVTQSTSTTAYFNIGLVHGVRPNSRVEIYRGKSKLGECIVTQISDKHASCAYTQARPGDQVVLRQATIIDKKQSEPHQHPTVSVIESYYAMIQSAPASKVVYLKKQTIENNRYLYSNVPVQIAADYQTWRSSGYESFNQQSIDLSVDQLPIYSDNLTGSLDTTTSYWNAPSNRRFRPGDDLQFYVWQSSVTYQNEKGMTSVTLGRLRTWNVPGLTVIDGAQLDIIQSEKFSFGAYGGASPKVETLGISTDQLQLGTYIEHEIARTDQVMIRQQLRVGYVKLSGIENNLEIEHVLMSTFNRSFSSSLQTKLNVLGTRKQTLDYLGLDMFYSPVEIWNVRFSGQLNQHQSTEFAFLDTQKSRRGETSVSWHGKKWLTVSALAGYVQQTEMEKVHRLYTGPEVSMDFKKTGVSLGHQQEWGWIGGHSTYLRPFFQVTPDLRVMPQLSYTHEIQTQTPYNEWGASFSCISQLMRWLDVSASVYSRFGDGPLGMGGNLSLIGRI